MYTCNNLAKSFVVRHEFVFGCRCVTVVTVWIGYRFKWHTFYGHKINSLEKKLCLWMVIKQQIRMHLNAVIQLMWWMLLWSIVTWHCQTAQQYARHISHLMLYGIILLLLSFRPKCANVGHLLNPMLPLLPTAVRSGDMTTPWSIASKLGKGCRTSHCIIILTCGYHRLSYNS